MAFDILSRIMDAAALAEAMRMPHSSGMGTGIVLSVDIHGVTICVSCSSPRGITSREHIIPWVDINCATINPLVANLRAAVKEVQERAYGRSLNYSKAPERLP